MAENAMAHQDLAHQALAHQAGCPAEPARVEVATTTSSLQIGRRPIRGLADKRAGPIRFKSQSVSDVLQLPHRRSGELTASQPLDGRNTQNNAQPSPKVQEAQETQTRRP